MSYPETANLRETSSRIAAIVLAAGLSRRMGRPKLVLPWGGTTVIGRVAGVLVQAGLSPIVVVTGAAHLEVEQALHGLPIQTVFNARYTEDTMTISLQVGLAALENDAEAALVVLGDQPQIEVEVARGVVRAYLETHAGLVVPSYQMRRGHPWLIARSLWPAAQALHPTETPRDLLTALREEIYYLEVDTSSILRDLDTPEDYEREVPKPGIE